MKRKMQNRNYEDYDRFVQVVAGFTNNDDMKDDYRNSGYQAIAEMSLVLTCRRTGRGRGCIRNMIRQRSTCSMHIVLCMVTC
jgi:hypothetical protein